MNNTLVRFCRLLLLGLAVCLSNGSVRAHEIRPAIVTLSLASNDHYDATVTLNIEALIAGIGPQHTDTNDAPEAVKYNALRALSPDALRAKFDEFSKRWLDGVTLEVGGTRVRPETVTIVIPAVGDPAIARISTVQLSGTAPSKATTLRWTYAAEFGSSIVRLKREGQETLEIGWLKDGQTSGNIDLTGAAPKGAIAKFLNYISVGFTHIIPLGLDHILFVLGLYLLAPAWRPLLTQVTAFTVAHSITLGLGLYGVLAISPAIVEPLIALSIVYVAVENIMTAKLQVWRPIVVFCFGLLHGLGFAGVLHEIGLPRTDYVIGLLGFNVGVELGQLAVIVLAFLLSGLWFRNKTWYRQRIVWPASAAIALVGAFWTIERIWFA
jgi:hydrogenase/urease accessory protein HupE